MTGRPQARTGHLDAARLWSGGIATAVVAALIAVLGILLFRGVFGVPVLAPKGDGVWGSASTATYAVVSGGIALAATGFMQLLSVTTPKYHTFFTWIMVLLTGISVLVPLSLKVDWNVKLATGLINLVIGIAITVILNSVARSAYRRPPPPPGQPGPAGFDGGAYPGQAPGTQPW
jgi:hypothetical protein